MPRFAANLSLMYAEHAFAARFAAAARDGFTAVECQFPYQHPAAELAQALADAGLQQVLINAPAGDWATGDRGLAGLPGREDEFRRGLLEQALPYAQALGCARLHLMAGVAPPETAPEALRQTLLANLDWAVQQAPAGLTLLIEPLNPRDMPGYLLQRQEQAHAILAELGHPPKLKVQMDLYHCQISEGDLAAKLRRYLPTGRVGHVQIAAVPDRGEPEAQGELNWPWLLALLDELGYAGFVGCEYRPRGASTSAGLGWLAPYGFPAAER